MQGDEDKELASGSVEKLAADEASDGQSGLAGRELDAAVAERVMGWSNVHYNGRTDRVSYKWMGIPPDGRSYNTEVRYFSTDIAAAMEVLNKADGMWELMQCVEREVLDDESTPFVLRYRCSLRFGDNLGHASGCATAPEAICRAALAAVSTQGEMISK